MAYNIRFFIFLYCCLSFSLANAQSPAIPHARLLNLRSYTSPAPTPRPHNLPHITALQQKFAALLPNFQSGNSQLQWLETRKSPMGSHYSFQQTYKGIPIYGTHLRLNTTADDQFLFATDNSFSLSPSAADAACQMLAPLHEPENYDSFLMLYPDNIPLELPQPVLLPLENGNIQPAFYVSLYRDKDACNRVDYILDLYSNIILQRDRRTFYAPPTTGTEAVLVEATANVFMPDPISSASATYGANGFTDNDDSDSPQLTAQLRQATLDVSLQNGTYSLTNPYVTIFDFNQPINTPVTTSQPAFNFTRADDAFEPVNAFYFITELQKYVQTLGFDIMTDKQLQLDARSTVGGDEYSYFVNTGSTYRIALSTSGVDDGEDAEVPLHEYTHALSEYACGNCNVGYDRNALDEALGDYIATSFTRNITPYKWEWVFPWDGHNEFWLGRNVNTNKNYSIDYVSSGGFYRNSEIFSGALMDIWDELGKATTDKLVLQSLYSFSPDITLIQAAGIMLLVDQQINGGANNGALTQYFSQRGLIDKYINAGDDSLICEGDSLQIGMPNTNFSDVTAEWSPKTRLSDYTSLAPIATPDRTTLYHLTITDLSSNIVYRDSVLISVAPCFDSDYTANAIRLLNTSRFSTGGNLYIEVPPNTENVSVSLFNTVGQYLETLHFSGDGRIQLQSEGLPAGIYVLRIKADNIESTFKIARGL